MTAKQELAEPFARPDKAQRLSLGLTVASLDGGESPADKPDGPADAVLDLNKDRTEPKRASIGNDLSRRAGGVVGESRSRGK